MKFEVILSKRDVNSTLVMINNKFKYIGYKMLKQEKNEVEINDENVFAIYFKINKKRTENIILANNIEKLKVNYSKKRKKYEVSLEKKDGIYGKVLNQYYTDTKNLSYRKKNNKKVTYYFSPNFHNKDVHLIVFFDSQNTYDVRHFGPYTQKNDPYGSWQLEVPISLSGKNFIVAGVENADKYRTNELTPYVEARDIRAKDRDLIHGNLENLMNFVHENVFEYLKDYDIVDVGVGGASMGGLASVWIGLMRPDIYKYIFSFSPATGLLKDSYWKELFKEHPLSSEQYLFNFQGSGDPLEKYLDNCNKNLFKNIINGGFDKKKIVSYYDSSLKHNEISWRYAFNYGFNKFYNE